MVALRILQPVQHVADGRGGGRAPRGCAQIQGGAVLRVELPDGRHLPADGLPRRLQRTPAMRRRERFFASTSGRAAASGSSAEGDLLYQLVQFDQDEVEGVQKLET